MNSLLLIITFIFGTVIGSFLNVCIYRIPQGESIAYPPSHCGKCQTRIKPYDLIPILSWILLKGKCRKCGEKISYRYALVEFCTGVLFMLTYLNYGLSLDLIKFLVFISFMIVIGMIDFDTMEVYFSTTSIAMALGAVFIGVNFYFKNPIMTYIYGGLLGAGTITGVILLSKIIIGQEGMGWGDVEICAICGLFLGFEFTLVMVVLSFILGGIAGTIILLTKKKNSEGMTAMAFGPSIAIAGIFMAIYGEKFINFYFQVVYNAFVMFLPVIW